ncbi:MAG: DUF309 domain-containing protein [Planctomycetes bacterium]|nr:DUF309 domain-containing protein [Planctomycetota bacterium]
MNLRPGDLPEPPDPRWPRYSERAFPPYRFVPGRTPHPQRDPEGHLRGREEVRPAPMPAERWRENSVYVYGIDLYNYAYWWECHEALEGLWLSEGRVSRQAQFLQGLIQVSAANLRRFMGSPRAARRLMQDGLARLSLGERTYMGLDAAAFSAEVRAYFEGERPLPALIRLGG